MKALFLLLLTLTTANAEVTCKLGQQNLPLIDQNHYVEILVDGDGKDTLSYGNDFEKARKILRFCEFYANSLKCEAKNITVPEREILRSAGGDIWTTIPEHTETRYFFKKKSYYNLYRCETAIAHYIRSLAVPKKTKAK